MSGLSIRIQVAVDDEIVAQRTAESFGIAVQNLDSLERWYEGEVAKTEAMIDAQIKDED